MPMLDRTGPLGFGPGSGWGLGPCGRGLALRRGFGRGFYRPWSRKEMLEALKEEAEVLKEELSQVEKEAKELKEQK